MRKFLRVLVLTVGFSTFNAFAIQKTCIGADNCDSVLGESISIEINEDSLKVVSAPGFEEGEGTYPFNKIEGNGNRQYAGADEEQQDGYIFSIDPDLLHGSSSKPITVTVDSGVEGKITASYTCHD